MLGTIVVLPKCRDAAYDLATALAGQVFSIYYFRALRIVDDVLGFA